MYEWRKMSERARREALAERKRRRHPWHSPPHWNSDRTDRYLFTAACFEHHPFVGHSIERMGAFEETLLTAAQDLCPRLFAWAVLPNHYHFLAQTSDAVALLRVLGQVHGRASFQWNGEEERRGRKVWCNAVETAMKSERHFWATMNYVHQNPVKHGFAERWQDWPFSSAAEYLEHVGRDEAQRIWQEYPIDEYGRGWDD